MLESFEAQNIGIRDIKGLEFAENLVNLNIGSNQVEDILPLRNLVKITGIKSIRQSSVEFIPFGVFDISCIFERSSQPNNRLKPPFKSY